MRKTFIEALCSHARLKSDMFLIVGDLGYGVIDNFVENYPDLFVNAGVAEQNMTGVAAGLSMSGRNVFTYSIANFPTFRAFEQIRNDVVYHNLPVTIVSVGVGLGYGVLGYSHHAIEDISVMRSMPGIRIFSPGSDEEIVGIVDYIIKNPQPTYLRLSKDTVIAPYEVLSSKPATYPTPVWLSDGDVLILCTGAIANRLFYAINASSDMIKKRCSIFAIPQIKPLNVSGIQFERYSQVLTFEEHTLPGGFGSVILEHLSETPAVSRVRRFGIPDNLNKIVGDEHYLQKLARLDVEGLTSQIEKCVY